MPKTAAKSKKAQRNVYAVVGSDESEVKRSAAALAEQLAPADLGDFGTEVIDGCADNTEQAVSRIRAVIEALETLPFMGGTKLVWLKNANCLADTQIGRAASVQSALEELCQIVSSDLAPGVTFLISATEVDKRRSFYKALSKCSELQVFDRLDSNRSGWEEEAAEIVKQRATERNLTFDQNALELFVLLTGGDTRQIDNELEKLELFRAPNHEVSVADVRELVPLSRAGVIFELGNALAQRELDRALILVRRLLDQGETAIGILLVAILPTVRNLLLAKDLMEHYRLPRPHVPFTFISALNRLPQNATQHLPRKKDGTISGYALGIAAQHAHRFDTRRLIEAMEACLQANLRLVTTQLDHELVLTEIVVKLLAEDTAASSPA